MKIFKSKTHLIGFVLIVAYCILNILSVFITTLKFSNITKTFVSLIPIFLILCYLFFVDKTFKFKKYMFPLAFGIIVCKNLYFVVASIVVTPKNLYFEEEFIILFAICLFLLLFNILCFIGTLFNFRFSIFLRTGCIGYISTIFIMQIYEFIALGGIDYINSIPREMLPISIISLIKYLSIILFYTGIFILTTNKKNLDFVWQKCDFWKQNQKVLHLNSFWV